MVPFGLSEEQFCLRYRRELDYAASQTIGIIRALLERPPSPEILFADVEIFVDDYGGAPDVWIYYRGENNKVDSVDTAIFPGRSINLKLPLNGLANFDEKYYADENFRGLFLAANLTKFWFAECWWKAGGWSYPIATMLRVHDDLGDGGFIQLTEHNQSGTR